MHQDRSQVVLEELCWKVYLFVAKTLWNNRMLSENAKNVACLCIKFTKVIACQKRIMWNRGVIQSTEFLHIVLLDVDWFLGLVHPSDTSQINTNFFYLIFCPKEFKQNHKSDHCYISTLKEINSNISLKEVTDLCSRSNSEMDTLLVTHTSSQSIRILHDDTNVPV